MGNGSKTYGVIRLCKNSPPVEREREGEREKRLEAHSSDIIYMDYELNNHNYITLTPLIHFSIQLTSHPTLDL